MTKILTALTVAVTLGLSIVAASAEGGYLSSGSIASQDPSLPLVSVRH